MDDLGQSRYIPGTGVGIPHSHYKAENGNRWFPKGKARGSVSGGREIKARQHSTLTQGHTILEGLGQCVQLQKGVLSGYRMREELVPVISLCH